MLINAMLLAEGWNSPRATVCMHLAPTASRRVYQQRIGRIMRIHPRKEAGVVVDFVPKSATHSERVVSLHALLDSDFYREGARVTPAPRRRQQRRARRKLSPVPWLVPVTPDVARRLAVIQREWQRIDPEVPRRRRAAVLGDDRRAPDPLRPARRVREEVRRRTSREGCARAVPLDVRRREPEPPAADDRAHGSRRDPRRPRRLRRPRDAGDTGAAVGEGSRRRRADPPARDRRREAARARSDPRSLDLASRARNAKGAGPPRLDGVPRSEAAPRRGRELARLPPRGERQPARPGGARDAACRSARRSSPPPTATRRVRTRRSTMPARSSARSRRSQTRSPTTSRCRSSRRASRGVAGASARQRHRPTQRPRPGRRNRAPTGQLGGRSRNGRDRRPPRASKTPPSPLSRARPTRACRRSPRAHAGSA